MPEPSTAVFTTATSAHCTVTVAVELLLFAVEVSWLELMMAVFGIGPHCAAVAFVVLVSVIVIELPDANEKFALLDGKHSSNCPPVTGLDGLHVKPLTL